jgi:uncharacterized protein YuzE
MNYKYDSEHDVLYLYFGKTKPSYADEAAPGIYLKFSEKDETITGAVIMDFLKKNYSNVQKYIPLNIDFNEISQQLN